MKSELQQSAFISSILEHEPTDKVYIRKEDERVGGYRNGPAQQFQSFLKQMIGSSKVQYKYHEAEMMDIDNVKPLTLIPTDRIHRKREYQ